MKAATGIFARLTPTMHKALTGALTKDKRVLGRIWFPVLMSQAAFMIDHVHITAAIIVAVRTIHLRGHFQQDRDNSTSSTNKKATSANIHPRYSSPLAYRRE
ncbi:MAG: hypothetical protein AMJ65_16350 [Phycisphaerae bacterium SG8_4]|nr:MAG: hypothetical protein AMJ65_16350 [Phycisphaerae bacterium SG8_4]